MHADMSPEEKIKRYEKVSESLKRYYGTDKGKKELQNRILKNKETNKKVATQWREEFKSLFKGQQPESFRKYGKQKEANQLFKNIRNLSSENKK